MNDIDVSDVGDVLRPIPDMERIRIISEIKRQVLSLRDRTGKWPNTMRMSKRTLELTGLTKEQMEAETGIVNIEVK